MNINNRTKNAEAKLRGNKSIEHLVCLRTKLVEHIYVWALVIVSQQYKSF